ncbi:hypothetical protein [Sphingopyxis macrogoltabida]|uniref:Uncharacterized protein n=1 Tax=Sphingopyxis macrogoltabida TaxID=33050 RepID=A0A0N7GT99_SPHMC|nr:hypothetical protein [Sphingopyxis macrogoltabida]ALH82923.1 hypothetical protein AN936_21960 [Sphingopyxis macrogoltabida]
MKHRPLSDLTVQRIARGIALLLGVRPTPADPEPRDESGRYISPHRLAVRAKCREQCAKIGREVPEALR